MGIRVVNCQGCTRPIATGTDFVLAGNYPSFSMKIFSSPMYGLDTFGSCYHKACYDLVILVGGDWGSNP